MPQPTLDRETILQTIQSWSQDEQLALARAIIERADAAQEGADAPRRSIWDELYGAASNGKEPPTDEEVAQWLDEHKMEKYGR